MRISKKATEELRRDATANTDTPEIPRQPGGEIIWVVEDDPHVRNLTLNRLDHLGYVTLEAASGAEALEVLKNSPGIDLVFTDMVMPGGMTGGELIA